LFCVQKLKKIAFLKGEMFFLESGPFGKKNQEFYADLKNVNIP
jgi:uncharacterized protein YqhQ